MAHTLIIDRTPKGRLRFKCECGVEYVTALGRTFDDMIEWHRDHLHLHVLGGTFDKIQGECPQYLLESLEDCLCARDDAGA